MSTAAHTPKSRDGASPKPPKPHPHDDAHKPAPPPKKHADVVKGRVGRFLLSPRGDIDGLLLDDGSQIATPPHLGVDLVAAIKPGDDVDVHGHREHDARIVARRIVNRASGASVVDDGPPDKHDKHEKHAKPEKRDKPDKHGKHAKAAKPSPHHDRQTRMQADGTIDALLRGKHGEINGAVLSDETILRFPRHTGAFYADLLAKGNAVSVRGMGLDSEHGRVIEAQEISSG